jgi:hypothetical protein
MLSAAKKKVSVLTLEERVEALLEELEEAMRRLPPSVGPKAFQLPGSGRT